MKDEDTHYKKVSYLGIPGSYSFAAAKYFFGNDIVTVGLLKVKDVLKNTKMNISEPSVVPLENSLTGSITETYDALLETKLSIIGEVKLYIHHNLLAKKNNISLTKMRRVYSHPQAIAQCDNFLRKYPNITPVYTSDTASAAKLVSEKRDPESCAIAGKDAARVYGLDIIASSIENNTVNSTRFAVIARKPNSWGEKLSITVSLAHVPGALYKALKPFALRNINLTKIESRPIFGRIWEYIFFIDFELNQPKEIVLEALRDLKKATEFVHIFGYYDKGKVYET